MQPIIIINFKAYSRGTGDKALALAKTCSAFGAWVAMQPTDIRAAVQAGTERVLAQHVDAIEFGAHTGLILPESVKEAGAWGTLLNHSERRITEEILRATVARCKEIGLETVVCASSVEEAARFIDMDPSYIAVELPELISGDVSIVTADPGIVTRAVAALGPRTLMGAGVHSGEDVQKTLEFGAAGVILASAVVEKAADPRAALEELYSTTK